MDGVKKDFTLMSSLVYEIFFFSGSSEVLPRGKMLAAGNGAQSIYFPAVGKRVGCTTIDPHSLADLPSAIPEWETDQCEATMRAQGPGLRCC